jgi:hypothetical protein
MHVVWDWASEAHDVTVIDDAGGVVDRWALTHDEAGIAATIERLADRGIQVGWRWRSRRLGAW